MLIDYTSKFCCTHY